MIALSLPTHLQWEHAVPLTFGNVVKNILYTRSLHYIFCQGYTSEILRLGTYVQS